MGSFCIEIEVINMDKIHDKIAYIRRFDLTEDERADLELLAESVKTLAVEVTVSLQEIQR